MALTTPILYTQVAFDASKHQAFKFNVIAGDQVTGAHDAYKKGDKVKFEGKIYESLIDANTYSPSAYPAGWKEITE